MIMKVEVVRLGLRRKRGDIYFIQAAIDRHRCGIRKPPMDAIGKSVSMMLFGRSNARGKALRPEESGEAITRRRRRSDCQRMTSCPRGAPAISSCAHLARLKTSNSGALLFKLPCSRESRVQSSKIGARTSAATTASCGQGALQSKAPYIASVLPGQATEKPINSPECTLNQLEVTL
jgi:hypothetical protein